MKAIRNIEKIEWLIVMALCGGAGVMFGIALQAIHADYVDQVQPDVVVVHKKNQVTAALERIETPTFKAGELATIFTADQGKMVTEKKYTFTNARLVTLYEGTGQIKSVMTADQAEMEFADSSMNEVVSSRWKGNFKRQQFRKGASNED